MAKTPTGSSSTGKTKAGKKSGSYTPPPAANPENQGARFAGLQQFVAKKFPEPIPSQKGSWEQAMDSLCRHYGVRRIRKPSNDTGIRYDASRKAYIMPPNRRVDEGS